MIKMGDDLPSDEMNGGTWQAICRSSDIKVEYWPGATILLHPALDAKSTQTLPEV
jgi:hypothetical protein